jgi:hypothetical protein
MDMPWNLHTDGLDEYKRPPSSEAIFNQLDHIRRLQSEIRTDHASLESVGLVTGAMGEDSARFFDERQKGMEDIMSKVESPPGLSPSPRHEADGFWLEFSSHNSPKRSKSYTRCRHRSGRGTEMLPTGRLRTRIYFGLDS